MWISAARCGLLRDRSIATDEWQLRHSRLSFAFSRAHSCLASSRRCVEEFPPGVDRAEDLAPDLLRGLHLAGDLVGPFVRHMAVRAGGAHAGPVGEMDRAGQLLIDVVLHLVARGAELLGVGQLERGVEGAPEHHAADEAAERQEAEAERRGRRASGCARPTAAQSLSRRIGLLASGGLDAQLAHVLERFSTSGRDVGLRHVAGGAEVAPRRDVGEHLAVAVM